MLVQLLPVRREKRGAYPPHRLPPLMGPARPPRPSLPWPACAARGLPPLSGSCRVTRSGRLYTERPTLHGAVNLARSG